MADVPAVVCIDIVIVIVVARSVGALFRRLGQPSVVGEIVAGIALGPSVLGALPGHFTTRLFPLVEPGESGHWRRVADRLRPLPVPVSVVDTLQGGTGPHPSGPGALLVGGSAGRVGDRDPAALSHWSGSVLAVYGHDDPQRVGLEQRLLRLAELVGPAGPPGPAPTAPAAVAEGGDP